MRLSTFSIVAADPGTGDLGVAVASKFLAVGAVVPFARAGVGAVATQALANTTFGPRGLELLASALHPTVAVGELLADDPDAPQRQFALVDPAGRSATFTGPGCSSWAGGRAASGYAVQGNILTGPEVVEAMETTFLATTGPLADRLLKALAAGDATGGDRRGRQSAALLVVREGGGYGGWNDRYLDLRVDDHTRPIEELGRLRDMHRLYFDRSSAEDAVPLDEATGRQLRRLLTASGDLDDSAGDGEVLPALQALFGRENLEERWREDDAVDGVALRYLRQKYGER